VNSYYDETTKNIIKKIAINNRCDFINVQNRGYGYGNNMGIAFAIKKYVFDYLIISNPDVVIEKYDTTELDNLTPAAFGPIIKTSKGKNQNPYWVHHNLLTEGLIYAGYKHNIRPLLFVGIALNKVAREIFVYILNNIKLKKIKSYALHGSFVIFNSKLLSLMGPPYDENIFLFGEESDIAYRIRKLKAKSYVLNRIVVMHKEDGSVGISNINISQQARRSVIYTHNKNKGE
jgi:GT2 family glycosyltransferase